MKIEDSKLIIDKQTKFFKSELFKIWGSEDIVEIRVDNDVEKSVIFDAFYFSLHKKCPININLNFDKEMLKPNVTCLVLAYNNPTFVSNMCDQLKNITDDIVIVDNNSNFAPMKNFIETCGYQVFKMHTNHGHKVYELDCIKRIIGPVFVLTDPDIQLPNSFTRQMISKMYDLSVLYQVRKVGVALDIEAEDLRDDVKYEGKNIRDWEEKFWSNRVLDQELEMYWADIDTTFCLVNNNFDKWPYIRIAGDYTSRHLPWHKGWESILIDGEYDAYMYCNRSTNWCKKIKIF